MKYNINERSNKKIINQKHFSRNGLAEVVQVTLKMSHDLSLNKRYEWGFFPLYLKSYHHGDSRFRSKSPKWVSFIFHWCYCTVGVGDFGFMRQMTYQWLWRSHHCWLTTRRHCCKDLSGFNTEISKNNKGHWCKTSTAPTNYCNILKWLKGLCPFYRPLFSLYII